MQNQTNQVKNWKHQLKIFQRKLDSSMKDIPKLFPFSVTVKPYNQKITQAFIQIDNAEIKLQKQQHNTNNKLQIIDKQLNQLKQTLKHYEHTNQYLVKVQNLSQGVYNKMQNFKIKMADSYDELAQLQQKILLELEIYEKKIENIQNGQQQMPIINKNNMQENRNINKQKVIKIKQKQQQQQINKLQQLNQCMQEKQHQCENIQGQIRQLGKNLGWVQEDHQDFISIWNRSQGIKNYFQIQQQLGRYFQLYTEQQIKDHMNKHLKHKKLTQLKKQCIYQYKIYKQQKKNQQMKLIQIQQLKHKQKQYNQEDKKKFIEEQRIMKEKIINWKKQKEFIKIKEDQVKLQQQRKNKEKINSKVQEQQIRRKQILEQWRIEQQEKKMQSVRNSRKRPSSAISKQTQQRIRQREQKLIKQKIQRALQKKIYQQQLKNKQLQMKQKKNVKYAYINSKLQQETTTIKQKKRDKFDGVNKKDADTFGGKLLMTGIRAIPSWRQGL